MQLLPAYFLHWVLYNYFDQSTVTSEAAETGALLPCGISDIALILSCIITKEDFS